MQDTIGVTTITGGTIEGCTAALGGAIYMEGGTFTLSGTGTIQNNKALRKENDALQGYGGAVYVTGGTANMQGGTIDNNSAQVRGGGLYVTSEGDKIGTVNVVDGSITNNIAGFKDTSDNLPADVGRGGGVYLEGGQFTMTGGEISDNMANYRGGGIFLTKSPTLTAGTISGNTALDSGGGICVNGDAVTLEKPDMMIYGNTAKNGGGVAVLNGDFILNGGNVGAENKPANTATEKGGGVYVQAESTGSGEEAAANAIVNSGNIWYNSAEEGGGIYLADGKGNFTLEGESASINHNTATNGGGVYLYKDPYLNQGKIEANTATENGGGMYISDCMVTLNPTYDVTITGNGAKNGGGIYIHGLSSNAEGSVDTVSSASPDHKVGLLVDSNFSGTVSFMNNIATVSGGAVCVDVGRFELRSDKITITGNSAVNGGGVAVLNGNFTMTNGSIGPKGEGEANTATNGGGVYVSFGEIWLKGGNVAYNEATNGGGAYVTGGQLVMLGGSLANNTATAIEGNPATGNGGGGYVAGNFRMLDGSISGNSAKNGGGIHVNEGNIDIVFGTISNNSATNDGGGFHVFTAGKEVNVVMLSGSLIGNEAAVNGGGMAVESNSAQPIYVKIGCLRNHNVVNGNPSLSIPYEGNYEKYAEFDGKAYMHDSCPKVEHNQAGGIGGGFYMNSDASTLSFYCVEEADNIAQGTKTAGMDVVGGRVIIGDEHYHNHVYDSSDAQKDKHNEPWGFVSMEDATLVNGGQVDIYGDMTNPIFKKEVTVDIKETNDHFMDHRRAHESEERYKVHYIENFKINGVATGLYEAYQYDKDNAVIAIEGALYSRPGYTILGWCTEPSRTDLNAKYYEVGTTVDLASGDVPGMGIHSINCDKCGESIMDSNLLELYAIWEANGYTVVFEPNVRQGDTYTGEMEDQIHNYGEKKPLTKNEYEYPGHFFNSWNTKPDGSGVKYEDEQEVSNLTNKNGAKIVLYAQWDPCLHDDPDRWSYKVDEDDKKTLLRICSCGGQTLTATLYAEDTVYDGLVHPATLKLDDKTAWGDDAPTIVYTRKWLNDGLNHGEGTLPELSSDGQPFHAGEYTASITKPDGEAPEKQVTASVTYKILKADQDPPQKPTYTVPEDMNQVKIDKVLPHEFEDTGCYKHTAEAEYRLSYYQGSTLMSQEWKKIEGADTSIALTMDNAWTGYYAEVRYQELNDYNASPVARADAVYFYGGNVKVIIVCDDGIDYTFVVPQEEDVQSIVENGATLKLKTKDGYYIVSGEYSVKAELVPTPDEPGHPTVNKVAATEKEGEYSFTGILANSTLTITIGTARKVPQVSAQVVPRQVFRPITGTAATISRDSAFTAAFQVSNFALSYVIDGKTYNAYTDLKLTFGSSIPKDTTVILLDRRTSSYWYYRAGGEVSSVSLTEFKKMGGGETEKYSIPTPTTDDGYVNLNYQFIVDFSQSENGYSGDSLTMKLEAPKAGAISAGDTPDGGTPSDGTINAAPAIEAGVTVSMKNSSFTFEKTSESGLTCRFNCGFDKGAAASKWEKRASALVLTPNAGTNLPPDAQLKAEVEGRGTTYLYKTGDSFIVPVLLLQNSETKTVNLTLQSALFPKDGGSYSFTAQWLISPSKASKAPLSGNQGNRAKNVTFTSQARMVPSLKSTGTTRMLMGEQKLELNVNGLNLDGCTISAALLRKADDGSYSGTGWNKTGVSASGLLEVPLAGQTPGSFCLMLTVKKENSVTIVMEVPYYFVIKPTE